MISKILRFKKILLWLVLYLSFLGIVLHVYTGSPPDLEVEMYKGVPVGGPFGTGIEWSNVVIKGKADDLNIVRTTMGWMVDSEGNVHDLFFMKPIIIQHIRYAHRLGFKVYVSIRPQYGGFTGSSGVSEVAEAVRQNFFSQFNQRVLEWAEICEKLGVEMYAPIQECEVLAYGGLKWENGEVVGDEEISEWLQYILPQIRERYSGEIVCGGGAWGGAARSWEDRTVHGDYKLLLGNCDIDFTGYDYITFAPYLWHLSPYDSWSPDPTIEEYREYIRYSLSKLNEWAIRDGCKGIIIREMGGPTEFIQVVLEEGEDILKGIITTHYHWDDYPMVSNWFRERLP